MGSILFIGAINAGNIALGGQEAKNQIVLQYILEHCKTTSIDTKKWKTNPFILIHLGLKLLMKYDLILISTSSISAFRLISVLHFIGKTPNAIYMVIGGWFPTMLKSNPQRLSKYKDLKAIYCEGHKLVKDLEDQGLLNVKYLPNFKQFDRRLLVCNYSYSKNESRTKFLYLSRITEDKGAKLVLEALESIYKSDRSTNLQVDFYGVIDPVFSDFFKRKIESIPIAKYCGIMDMKVMNSYKILISENYRALLFCSTYIGEGFPGTLIDAMIIGVPVIATDWSINSEIVEDNLTGKLIKPNNLEECVDAINFFVENPESAYLMGKKLKENAIKYHVDNVLGAIIP